MLTWEWPVLWISIPTCWMKQMCWCHVQMVDIWRTAHILNATWCYHCIPWAYACDVKSGCPRGTDKVSCSSQRCQSMYKCVGVNSVCIHLGKICNGQPDLQWTTWLSWAGWRELLWFYFVSCLFQCVCILFELRCANSKLSSFSHFETFKFFSLVNVSLFTNFVSQISTSPVFRLALVNTSSLLQCNMLPTHNLTIWHIQLNIFQHIQKSCIKQSDTLVKLLLGNNKMQQIASLCFYCLSNVKHTNLSLNELKVLQPKFILQVPLLRTLSLEGNSFSHIDRNDFLVGFDNLQVLHTSEGLCCLVSLLVCTWQRKEHTRSCTILPNDPLRHSSLSVSVRPVILNELSIALSVAARSEYKFPFVATTILTDLRETLLGVHFLIIWDSDQLVQMQKFAFLENQWKSGRTCHLAWNTFVFFTPYYFYTILSPVLSSLLSCSTYSVVVSPILSKFKSAKFTVEGLLSLLALSVIAILTQIYMFELPTSLCVLFSKSENASLLPKCIIVVISIVQVNCILSCLIDQRNINTEQNNCTKQNKGPFQCLSYNTVDLPISLQHHVLGSHQYPVRVCGVCS